MRRSRNRNVLVNKGKAKENNKEGTSCKSGLRYAAPLKLLIVRFFMLFILFNSFEQIRSGDIIVIVTVLRFRSVKRYHLECYAACGVGFKY